MNEPLYTEKSTCESPLSRQGSAHIGVQIEHKPSGIVVKSVDQPSQHLNKLAAIEKLNETLNNLSELRIEDIGLKGIYNWSNPGTTFSRLQACAIVLSKYSFCDLIRLVRFFGFELVEEAASHIEDKRKIRCIQNIELLKKCSFNNVKANFLEEVLSRYDTLKPHPKVKKELLEEFTR